MLDPADDRGGLGHAANDVLLLIAGGKAFGERFGITPDEFGEGIDAGCFEERPKFETNAVDAVEIDAIGELQNQGFGGTGGGGEGLTLGGRPGGGEQGAGIGDPGCAEAGSEFGADAVDFFNFTVGHR